MIHDEIDMKTRRNDHPAMENDENFIRRYTQTR